MGLAEKVNAMEREMKMTKQQLTQLAHIKGEINSPKKALMRISAEIGKISPSQKARLDVIIGRLESLQNK